MSIECHIQDRAGLAWFSFFYSWSISLFFQPQQLPVQKYSIVCISKVCISGWLRYTNYIPYIILLPRVVFMLWSSIQREGWGIMRHAGVGGRVGAQKLSQTPKNKFSSHVKSTQLSYTSQALNHYSFYYFCPYKQNK